MVLIERYAMLPMVLVLGALLWLLWFTRDLPVEPIAAGAVSIMALHCASGLAISTLAVFTGLRNPVFTQLLPVSTDLFTGLLWAVWFVALARRPVEEFSGSKIEMAIATERTADYLALLRKTAAAGR